MMIIFDKTSKIISSTFLIVLVSWNSAACVIVFRFCFGVRSQCRPVRQMEYLVCSKVCARQILLTPRVRSYQQYTNTRPTAPSDNGTHLNTSLHFKYSQIFSINCEGGLSSVQWLLIPFHLKYRCSLDFGHPRDTKENESKFGLLSSSQPIQQRFLRSEV